MDFIMAYVYSITDNHIRYVYGATCCVLCECELKVFALTQGFSRVERLVAGHHVRSARFGCLESRCGIGNTYEQHISTSILCMSTKCRRACTRYPECPTREISLQPTTSENIHLFVPESMGYKTSSTFRYVVRSSGFRTSVAAASLGDSLAPH